MDQRDTRSAGTAEAAPRAEEKVYLDYTQDELDNRVFNTRLGDWDTDRIMERYASASAAVRATHPYRTLSYGPQPDEVLDLFPSARRDAPIFVFVHGGGWRLLSRNESAFPAPMF